MKVLLLYAKVGNGHLKATESIKQALQTTDDKIEIDYEDGLEYSSALTNKLIIKGYTSLIKNMPKLYGSMYKSSEKSDLNVVGEINKMVNKALTIRLKKMLRVRRPDIIISTHPFISHMCAYLKRKGKTNAKIISVITDYGLHNMWLEENEHIDKFMVATEKIKNDCMTAYCVDENKIVVTGIPISEEFNTNYDKQDILNNLGLDHNKTTILFFAGGGLGLGKSESMFEELLGSRYDFQVIAITGKNTKQKKKFEKIKLNTDKKVIVLGYTDKVPELISVSDFVITKPGGLTSAECLAMCKPMIIINPIPGQEEQNAIYFTNNGTAIRTYEDEPIDNVLDIVINNKQRVNQMIEMCGAIGKPNAAKTIAYEVIKLFNGVR